MIKGFWGEHEYKVDEKGRVPIPPRFRDQLRGEFVLTVVADKCIAGYPVEEWEQVIEQLSKGPLSGSRVRSLQRGIFGSAYGAEIDGQGRVALPSNLRNEAGIKDSCVIVGLGRKFELWSPELWGAERTKDREQAWQLIEGLETLSKQSTEAPGKQ